MSENEKMYTLGRGKIYLDGRYIGNSPYLTITRPGGDVFKIAFGTETISDENLNLWIDGQSERVDFHYVAFNPTGRNINYTALAANLTPSKLDVKTDVWQTLDFIAMSDNLTFEAMPPKAVEMAASDKPRWSAHELAREEAWRAQRQAAAAPESEVDEGAVKLAWSVLSTPDGVRLIHEPSGERFARAVGLDAPLVKRLMVVCDSLNRLDQLEREKTLQMQQRAASLEPLTGEGKAHAMQTITAWLGAGHAHAKKHFLRHFPKHYGLDRIDELVDRRRMNEVMAGMNAVDTMLSVIPESVEAAPPRYTVTSWVDALGGDKHGVEDNLARFMVATTTGKRMADVIAKALNQHDEEHTNLQTD